MLETATTILIIAGSMLLFGYWFRYTCLLILSAKTTRDYAGEVARANQLSFLEVQAQLRAEGAADLSRLNASLDRDYALVTYLIQNAAGGNAEFRVEDRMLQMNYNFTRFLFKTLGKLSPDVARHSLNEMSMVISHFANAMGERATVGAGA
ncbi:MAG: hypothetical protein ABI995_04045 [Acidobacteriota bacterium]